MSRFACGCRNPSVISPADPRAIARVASILQSGGVVGMPTDTVYGIASSIESNEALARLFLIKGRPREKAIPVLLSEAANLSLVALDVSPLAMTLAERFWPGALTIVVTARDHLPGGVTSIEPDGTRTVAVRVPDYGLATRIIEAVGGALAVTSANRSGEPPALTAQVLQTRTTLPLAAIVDGGRVPGGVPSTIVRVTRGDVEMLRQGAVSAAAILAAIAESRVTRKTA